MSTINGICRTNWTGWAKAGRRSRGIWSCLTRIGLNFWRRWNRSRRKCKGWGRSRLRLSTSRTGRGRRNKRLRRRKNKKMSKSGRESWLKRGCRNLKRKRSGGRRKIDKEIDNTSMLCMRKLFFIRLRRSITNFKMWIYRKKRENWHKYDRYINQCQKLISRSTWGILRTAKKWILVGSLLKNKTRIWAPHRTLFFTNLTGISRSAVRKK